jgi:hypothetical protein
MLVPPLPTAAAAGSGTLSLSASRTNLRTVGGRRTSPLASVVVTVPAVLPVRLGLQLRSASRSTGYRAALAIAGDGSVSGSITRMRSGVETTLLAPVSLGFAVRPGQTVRLDAAVVASSPVWLYLRARSAGAAAPSSWQLGVSDRSGSRITRSGRTYLWGEGSAATSLSYRSASASSTSAAKAAAVGVLPPEPGGDTFSLAVIPDTQAETNNAANTPFLNRVRWMVANKGRFDLRYVLHTGDLTNWGWLDAAQFTRARAAMDVLRRAGLPYAVAIGNHDTRAVGWDGRRGSTGYGGDAYMDNPECPTRLGAAACKSWLLVRHTEEFNQYFPLSGMGKVGGAYESGRADNYWTSFTANGTSWLVLTLELWPRSSVIDWAADVLGRHPDANVILQTHNYLDRKGRISGSNGGYGANSPAVLYRRLVSRFPNVKLVLSGHTGRFSARTDSPGRNTVVSYLGNDLGGPTHNPVRILSINTRNGDVFSTVFDPLHDRMVAATSNHITVIP